MNGCSTHGVGSELAVPQKPEITMDNVLQKSEAVEMRKGGDAIKSLAIGEDELEKMPMAEQPGDLKAQLLPYQLQVRSSYKTRWGLLTCRRDWLG